jgi:hypothetical protein
MELILNIFSVLTFPFLGIYILYLSLKRFRQIKKNLSYSNTIKKWMSLNEIGGFLSFFGFFMLLLGYFHITECGLNFEKENDGYYLIIDKADIDTHLGGVYEKTIFADGPFTELEVKKILDDCKTPLQELINNLENLN